MEVQEITLQVPVDFSLPATYNTATPKTTSTMLTLGASAYESMQTESQKLRHKALYDTLCAEAASKYEPQMAVLEKQHTEAAEAIERLQRRLAEAQSERLEIERTIRDEERRNRSELLAEKDSRIAALETQMRSALENGRNLGEQFQAFKEQMIRGTTGSTAKGKHGEVIFADLVRSAFGNVNAGEVFDVEEVGKEGHQGDLRMTWRGHKVMWEIKNYTRNVESREVTKFLRDMEECKDVSLGVMVSLSSSIAGHSRPNGIDIEELQDGRICVQLTNFFKRDEDPVMSLQVIRPFLEVFLRWRDNKGAGIVSEEIRIQRFQQQRALVQKLLAHHTQKLNGYRTNLANAKKRIDQVWLELTSDLREIEQQTKLVLEAATEDVEMGEEAGDSEKAAVELPGYVFRVNDLSLLAEADQRAVRALLDVFEFGEEYTLGTAEFKSALTAKAQDADAVMTVARDRLFASDVWPKGKKTLRQLRPKNSQVG